MLCDALSRLIPSAAGSVLSCQLSGPSGNCPPLERAAYFKVTLLTQGQPIPNDGDESRGKPSPLIPTGDNSQVSELPERSAEPSVEHEV